ncbi:MAG: UDP-N-acetylmuramate dehydrogenase [Bacillota bacterium]
MNWSQVAAEISKMTSGPVETAEPLMHHTTLRVGGPARVFCRPAGPTEVTRVVSWARSRGLPVYPLGGGSNLLVSDDGVRGIVVKTTPGLAELSRPVAGSDGIRVEIGAGAILADLLSRSVEWELAGLEPLAGIPGTVGGAVVMNAGAGGLETGSRVDEVLICDVEGNVRRLSAGECEFGYRDSVFQRRQSEAVVLRVWMSLQRGRREKIRAAIESRLRQRRRRLPRRCPSAGSVFRNPPGISAGYLIEAAGWKGRRSGGARVSPLHANFIVNCGDATAEDIARLIAGIRESVRDQFGVRLELELETWGVIDGL